MTRKKNAVYNIINAITDILVSDAAYILAIQVWLKVFRGDTTNVAENLNILAVYSVFLFILYRNSNLYSASITKIFTHEVIKIIQLNVFGILTLGLTFYVFRLEHFSRGVLVCFFILSTIFIIIKRLIFRIIINKYPNLVLNNTNVLVVGNGTLAKRFIHSSQRSKQYAFSLVGYLSNDKNDTDSKKLGNYMDLESILEKLSIDQVVIALEASEVSKYISHSINICDKFGTKVYIIPVYNDFFQAVPDISSIGDIKLLNMRTIPLDNSFYAIQKRIFDIILSLFFIIITSPIMIFTALAVRLSSRGPIVFRQQRVGRGKRIFTMYKFRSMRINNESTTAWTKDSDSRKTLIGSFIRKTSIDELLQFFNVLKGDMSIVGPRPEIPFYVNQFKETIPLYMLKHQVRPGITGWAQVNGLRGDTSIEDRIKYDLWYIENWNILLDIKIIVMTPFVTINNEKI